MRTIGKRNIAKLKRIIAEEYNRKDIFGNYQRGLQLNGAISDRIPAEWFEIWESAWAEIERVISDETSRLTYGSINRGINNLFTSEGR